MFISQIKSSLIDILNGKSLRYQNDHIVSKFENRAKFLLRIEYDLLKLYSVATLAN